MADGETTGDPRLVFGRFGSQFGNAVHAEVVNGAAVQRRISGHAQVAGSVGRGGGGRRRRAVHC